MPSDLDLTADTLFSRDLFGMGIQPPLVTLALILARSYLATLVTTYLPARAAARVKPAEALRYE
ncbi:MAG TPA: hypothetical protein VGS80_15295 [Ktedonobacterales bacterium]|nr:hypothetical protein [Ktedonobacterales bacterium]